MKKRMLALLLCFCLLLPLFTGSVFATGERQSTPYDGNIGKKAKLNPEYFGEDYFFFLSDNPEKEEGWDFAVRMNGTEALADLVLVITDALVVRNECWYKVEAAEGCTLPQDMVNCPWIFQNTDEYGEEYDSLIIDHTSVPEQTEPTEPEESEPTEPEETVPDPTEPEQPAPDRPEGGNPNDPKS